MKKLTIKISANVEAEIKDDITEDEAQELAYLLFEIVNKNELKFKLDSYLITEE